MPTEAAAKPTPGIASVRTLRLAFGTAASLWFSQAVGWDVSFIAPVLTMFLLALPLPALKLKAGVGLVLALVLAMLAGLAFLPRILNQPMVGLLLLMLALYWSFYFTAKGGSAAIGTLLTLGIAMATAVGTVSIDVLLLLIKGVSFGAVAGVVFVWIAHALIPDSLAADRPTAAPPGQAPAPPRRTCLPLAGMLSGRW